jgi:hypothetical protein
MKPMPGQQGRTVLFWLRLLVGLAVLGLIIRRIDLGAATVRPSPPLLAAVAGATGLLVMSQAVAALRWKIVLGEDALPWSYLWRLYMIGSFFGLFRRRIPLKGDPWTIAPRTRIDFQAHVA